MTTTAFQVTRSRRTWEHDFAPSGVGEMRVVHCRVCVCSLCCRFFLTAVPPLEGFVMNRVLGDYFETLLYKIFVSIDGNTPLSEVSPLPSWSFGVGSPSRVSLNSRSLARLYAVPNVD